MKSKQRFAYMLYYLTIQRLVKFRRLRRRDSEISDSKKAIRDAEKRRFIFSESLKCVYPVVNDKDAHMFYSASENECELARTEIIGLH